MLRDFRETACATGRLDMTGSRSLVHELNHRVKNNFQIIVSLMNLKMRMMPPEQRGDIRFLQEHVQCMAIAYRLVYDTGDMVEVQVSELLGEVVAGLRLLARLNVNQVRFDGVGAGQYIGLDQAISFGLYLSVVLPPYLDQARHDGGSVTIAVVILDGELTLTISGNWSEAVAQDFLRSRLGAAYANRLQAQTLPASNPSELKVKFLIDDRRLGVMDNATMDLMPWGTWGPEKR